MKEDNVAVFFVDLYESLVSRNDLIGATARSCSCTHKNRSASKHYM